MTKSLSEMINRKTVEGDCPDHGHYTAEEIFFGPTRVVTAKCPECERIRREIEAEEKRKYEEAERLRRAEQEKIDSLRRMNIPRDYWGKLFDSYKPQNASQQKALEVAQRFVKGWDKAVAGGYGLFFLGACGTGKTHLACAVMQSLMSSRQIESQYLRIADIIQHIRSSWRQDSEESDNSIIRRYVDLPLLVIDELGVQAGSDNERQLLFLIVDSRLSECRPTIFISNLTSKDIATVIGERLADRIQSKNVPLVLAGKSMRKPLDADVFNLE